MNPPFTSPFGDVLSSQPRIQHLLHHVILKPTQFHHHGAQVKCHTHPMRFHTSIPNAEWNPSEMHSLQTHYQCGRCATQWCFSHAHEGHISLLFLCDLGLFALRVKPYTVRTFECCWGYMRKLDTHRLPLIRCGVVEIQTKATPPLRGNRGQGGRGWPRHVGTTSLLHTIFLPWHSVFFRTSSRTTPHTAPSTR
jgi:hypothetical protein